MLDAQIKQLTSSAAWLTAATKGLERIAKWPAVDPSKKPAIEEFANSLERAGVKLVEIAEEIRKQTQ
jgi:hypothetical protein